MLTWVTGSVKVTPVIPTLTTRKVAKRLGLTVRQVHTLIANGELTPVARLDPPTGTYFFAESEVDRFAAAREAVQS